MEEIRFHSSALLANRELKSEVKAKCVRTEVCNDKVCNDSTYSVLYEITHSETRPSKKKEFSFMSGSGLFIFYLDLGKTH